MEGREASPIGSWGVAIRSPATHLSLCFTTFPQTPCFLGSIMQLSVQLDHTAVRTGIGRRRASSRARTAQRQCQSPFNSILNDVPWSMSAILARQYWPAYPPLTSAPALSPRQADGIPARVVYVHPPADRPTRNRRLQGFLMRSS